MALFIQSEAADWLGLGKLWENAAKMGPAALLMVVAVVALLGGFYLFNKKAVPGTISQASADKSRDVAVAVLQSENARLAKECDEEHALRLKTEKVLRECEQDAALFSSMKNDPAALRQYAARVRREQKEKEDT